MNNIHSRFIRVKYMIIKKTSLAMSCGAVEVIGVTDDFTSWKAGKKESR